MDLDNDGFNDVISGSHPGELYLFPGRPEGKFAQRQQIKDSSGQIVKIDYGSTPSAADWDDDGDFDLLVGTTGGSVHLVENQGSPDQYFFGKPQPLGADGEPIVAPKGHAAPTAADWDGDGKADLLVGAEDGSVLWYQNVGTSKEPKLAAGQTLVPPPKPESERGTFAKICATDWNEDGRLDLLVGDRGEGFLKELSEEEEQWREEVRHRQAELLQQWAEVFRQYRELLRAPKPEQPKQQRERHEELDALRERLQQLNRVRDTFSRQEQALEPGKQYHGRVWLFLRK